MSRIVATHEAGYDNVQGCNSCAFSGHHYVACIIVVEYKGSVLIGKCAHHAEIDDELTAFMYGGNDDDATTTAETSPPMCTCFHDTSTCEVHKW